MAHEVDVALRDISADAPSSRSILVTLAADRCLAHRSRWRLSDVSPTRFAASLARVTSKPSLRGGRQRTGRTCRGRRSGDVSLNMLSIYGERLCARAFGKSRTPPSFGRCVCGPLRQDARVVAAPGLGAWHLPHASGMAGCVSRSPSSALPRRRIGHGLAASSPWSRISSAPRAFPCGRTSKSRAGRRLFVADVRTLSAPSSMSTTSRSVPVSAVRSALRPRRACAQRRRAAHLSPWSWRVAAGIAAPPAFAWRATGAALRRPVAAFLYLACCAAPAGPDARRAGLLQGGPTPRGVRLRRVAIGQSLLVHGGPCSTAPHGRCSGPSDPIIASWSSE